MAASPVFSTILPAATGRAVIPPRAFLLTMSRQDIGCYLGLAVETVSRTLTRFQECGVLRVNRREVEILDHDTLRKIAGTRVSTASPDCCKTVGLKSV